MNKNILLCGVGGQGTVLAAKVLADAAIANGEEVKTTETIGMAQRGGSVVSHVRIGQKVHSPLIPMQGADLMLAFEPAEAVRNIGYLKEHATVVVSDKAVRPVTAALGGTSYTAEPMVEYLKKQGKKVILIDADALCKKCGSQKALNVILLGAATASGELGISKEEMLLALERRIKKQYYEMNRTAFEMGYEIGGQAK